MEIEGGSQRDSDQWSGKMDGPLGAGYCPTFSGGNMIGQLTNAGL